jgi:putative zinc finger protein
MQHLDEGTIHAWLDGALAGDEAAGVAKHVAECGDCAAMVAEARGIIAAASNIISALDSVRGGVIPMPKPVVAGQGSLWRRLRLTPGRAALAATLLVAVASLLTVRRMPRAGAPETRMTPAAQVATPVESESPEALPRKAARVVTKNDTAARSSPTSIAKRPALLDTERVMNAVTPKAEEVAANARSRLFDSAGKTAADRATSSVAAAPSAPDSIRSAGAAGAAASRTATDARPRFAPVGPLQQVVTTGLEAARAKTIKLRPEVGELEGCFQFREDSAKSAATAAAAAIGFPSRFALVNAAGVVPHVVRAVSAEGRVDSLASVGTWQRVTNEVVRVQFTSGRQQPVTLQLTTGAVTSQAVIGGQATSLRVAPIECRP